VFEDGAETPHSWTKGNSNEHLCWNSSNIQNDPNFLENIITCDESRFFLYDPESKCQSMHWKSPSSPSQKKARQSKSKFKAMMIIFFDICGIVHADWVPEDQTGNLVYYREVLTKLCEWVRRRRRTAHGFFTKTMRRHTIPSVQTFLTKHNITELEYPLYLPDLAPCDFFYFQRSSLH